MAQPRKEAVALTAVIQRVFPEDFRQPIARCGADRGDAEVGPESLAISLRALFPLRRSVLRLVNAGNKGSADDGIGAERVEEVVVELRLFCWTRVHQIWFRRRRFF